MVQRQDREDPLSCVKGQDRTDRIHIAHDVLVREHNALTHRRRTGRKQDDMRRFRVDLDRTHEALAFVYKCFSLGKPGLDIDETVVIGRPLEI